jgi:hypothetical protein
MLISLPLSARQSLLSSANAGTGHADTTANTNNLQRIFLPVSPDDPVKGARIARGKQCEWRHLERHCTK